MQRQSLLLLAPHQLAWVAEELPPLLPDEVLVRTTAGAVSIGTELPQYTGAERVIVPRAYPRMTGYESVGTVIERVARGSPGNTVRIAGVV
jgi:NADPH:quinone reductase-like Zn-dependent oxidoreductase